jgi:hypothetical protein
MSQFFEPIQIPKFRHFIYITSAREWLWMQPSAVVEMMWRSHDPHVISFCSNLGYKGIAVGQKPGTLLFTSTLDKYSWMSIPPFSMFLARISGPAGPGRNARPRAHLILVAHGMQFLGDVVCPSSWDIEGARRYKHGLSGCGQRWCDGWFTAVK